MLTKNELKRFKKKEQSCTNGNSHYYDEHMRLLDAYNEAKKEADFASENRCRSRAQLDKIDPERCNVDPDKLTNGPWKAYVIFRAEKLASIKKTREKMKKATKKVYLLMNKVNDPSFNRKDIPDIMKRIKDNVSQFSGWEKSIESAHYEIDRKRAEASLIDLEYQRLNSVWLEDNAVYSEKYGKENQLEKELEKCEYKYRVAMEQKTSK